MIGLMTMSQIEKRPTREELSRLVSMVGDRFIQRKDIYSRQQEDGRYLAIHRQLYPSHLKAHLKGEITLGVYALNEESQGRFLVLDADDEPDWRRLQALAGILAEVECSSYLEGSRRGGHLWLFFADQLPGKEIREFGHGLFNHFGIENIELFPKQDRLTTGPGSLIRLPFGVHQKSGKRYGYYTADGRPLAPTLREQIVALKDAETVPEAVFEKFKGIGTDVGRKRRPAPAEALQGPVSTTDEDAPLSDQLKATIPVRQFVLRYVELSPKGMGLCPFHDDTVDSFGVNDEGNFWHCFACDKGGSIIDFWMQYNDCDFQTAIKELAKMLLEPHPELASFE